MMEPAVLVILCYDLIDKGMDPRPVILVRDDIYPAFILYDIFFAHPVILSGGCACSLGRRPVR